MNENGKLDFRSEWLLSIWTSDLWKCRLVQLISWRWTAKILFCQMKVWSEKSKILARGHLENDWHDKSSNLKHHRNNRISRLGVFPLKLRFKWAHIKSKAYRKDKRIQHMWTSKFELTRIRKDSRKYDIELRGRRRMQVLLDIWIQ